MYSKQLIEIERTYASKYGVGLPLTAEQLLNAVVEWVVDYVKGANND